MILWRPKRKQPNLVPPYDSNQPLPTLWFHQTLGGDLKSKNTLGGDLIAKHVLKKIHPVNLWQKHDGNMYWSSWKKTSSMQVVLLRKIIIANPNWYLKNQGCLRSSHRAARSHPLMVSRMYISTSGAWWVEGQTTQYVWCIYVLLLPILTRNLVVCKQPFTDSMFIFRGVGQSPQVVPLITEGHQTL